MTDKNFREVGETNRGYKLYVEDNAVGGRSYWSAEIGGGVLIWDTCLACPESLELAIKIEKGLAQASAGVT